MSSYAGGFSVGIDVVPSAKLVRAPLCTSTTVCFLGSKETLAAVFRFIISSYAGGFKVGVYAVSSGKLVSMSLLEVELATLSKPFRHEMCVSGYAIKAAEFPLSWYNPVERIVYSMCIC